MRAEPDPRFVFEFDGEPECNLQVLQVQGRMKQPMFTCKFSCRSNSDLRSRYPPPHRLIALSKQGKCGRFLNDGNMESMAAAGRCTLIWQGTAGATGWPSSGTVNQTGGNRSGFGLGRYQTGPNSKFKIELKK